MEESIKYAVQIILILFQLYCIYRYMTIFFDNNYMDKKLLLVMYASRALLTIVLVFRPVSPLLNMISVLVSTYLIAMCYWSTFWKKVIIVFIIYLFGFIAESIVALAIGISGYHLLGQTAEASLASNMIIQLIFWAFTLVVQRCKNIRSQMPVPSIFIWVIMVIPICSICLELMIFSQKNIDNSVAGMSIIVTIIANFVLLYLYDSLSRLFQERAQSLVISREKDYYHEQLTMMQTKNNELRQFRHDIKNQLVVVQEMLKGHNYEQVVQYVEKVAKRFGMTEQYSASGNVAIDSILNYKLSKAKEMGIDVKANIAIPENIAIEEDDIVVILGNLLDNAIEANERICEGKFITVDFNMDRGNAFIRIKNSFDSVVRHINGEFLTRKEERYSHGIGLKSVDAVVQKYNGLVDIEYDEREFVVHILMYL